jgi:mevalonate kinase
MILSCPSKTFLLGEYVALNGGPTLLAATEPRFKLRIQQGHGENPFHADSPAGRLWNRDPELTRSLSAHFENPLHLGGLGASSAEFLLLHTALQVKSTLAWEAQLEPDLFEILKDYVDLSSNRGTKPSGADLVSQLRGRMTLFDKSRGTVLTRGWGFTDLSFLLFATGVKVPTHEHLANLGSWNDERLLLATEAGCAAWLKGDSHGFVEAVQAARAELRHLKFEVDFTGTLLDEILEDRAVLAAKGCGALGADVLMVLCRPADAEAVRTKVSMRLRYLAGDFDLAEGLQVIPLTLAPEAQA